MRRYFHSYGLVVASIFSLLVCFGPKEARSAEVLKLGTSVPLSALYYLPILAAEEKGFWKQNDLAVEWVPFQSGTDQVRALVAGSVNMGLSPATAPIMAISRGVPSVIVANVSDKCIWYIYVRGNSPFKQPKDLKGARIGVTRLGGSAHAYGSAIARALGIEKDVKFVGAGGIAEGIAALKTGSTDAWMMTSDVMAGLVAKGEVSPLIRVNDYLPKEWTEEAMFSHKDFLKSNLDTVKRVIKGFYQAVGFVQENPKWAVETIKTKTGFSDKEAELVYKDLAYPKSGKVDSKALENVKNFLVEYDQIEKDKVPPLNQVYVNLF
jgi:NitT/TauT family transport system substrate-binding protein